MTNKEWLTKADEVIDRAADRMCRDLRDKQAAGEKLTPNQLCFLENNEKETPEVVF